ncbi:MAG: hypothetical protein J2P15_07675 [Micromonosporaceae bacterium]|nr:hypothetical protein [Micromonosporaceae bacterium]
MSDEITVNPADLKGASDKVASVGGQVPNAFASAASSLGTASGANPGFLLGPAGVALGAAMGSALGTLGNATNAHAAWQADAATRFTQADDALTAAQKPLADGIDAAGAALKPRGSSS